MSDEPKVITDVDGIVDAYDASVPWRGRAAAHVGQGRCGSCVGREGAPPRQRVARADPRPQRPRRQPPRRHPRPLRGRRLEAAPHVDVTGRHGSELVAPRSPLAARGSPAATPTRG